VDIGVVTEIKKNERRVAMTPAGVAEATHRGHVVNVQSGAGLGSSLTDEEFVAAGATMVASAEEVFERSTLLVHVKEPQANEIALLRADHILFTYLHLAAYPSVAEGLKSAGCTAIAYETVADSTGFLPLLAPMSFIAGRLSIQAGAHHLEAPHGGRGTLLGGYPGVPSARVTVLGAGSAGQNAVDVAVGMGAQVTVLDLDQSKLNALSEHYGTRITTQFSSAKAVTDWTRDADLVVGAVLVAGGRAPVLVTEEHIKAMKPGAVVVDISIDQGGCFATSHETSHTDPTYVIDDVVHYAVGNIPGAVPHTSTWALTNATMNYVTALAAGLDSAIARFPELLGGVNTKNGKITNEPVAKSLGESFVPVSAA